VAERWALCQALPANRLQAVTEGLRASGYRPTRVRPYADGQEVRQALVWARDGRDWRLESDIKVEAVRARDAEQQKAGYVPADIAGVLQGEGERYTVLWVKARKGEAARLYAGVSATKHKAETDVLKEQKFIPLTLQKVTGPDGNVRFAGVWGKVAGQPADGSLNWERDEWEHGGLVVAGEKLLVDVDLSPGISLEDGRQTWRDQLLQAEQELKAKADNLPALFRRAQARFHLGQAAEALADLDAFLARGQGVLSYQYRALLQARAGRAAEARRDLATFLEKSTSDNDKMTVRALVAISLGQAEEGIRVLEEAVKAGPADPERLSGAARAFAQASLILRRQSATRAAALVASHGLCGLLEFPSAQRSSGCADRAIALLRQALTREPRAGSRLSDTDLDPIRSHTGYGALLSLSRLDRRYASVWHGDPKREAVGLQGLAAEAHLARCRALAAKGYRPVALSLAVLTPGKPPLAVSVWQRPVATPEVAETRAKEQATAAATLLRLGEPTDTWPLFRHSPDPTARSHLVQRCNLLGVDAMTLVRRLENEKDVSARRALIVALGDYTEKDLPAPDRASLVEKLLGWYRDDPDPGVHGAIDWLLRQGKEGPVERPLDWGQAKALAKIDASLRRREPEGKRRWYVNRQGQTMVLVPGPVEFRMGSPLSEPERIEKSERPHLRRIARSFSMASRPVTVAEFQRFLKDRPDVRHNYMKHYSPEAGGPIISVTWFEAAQYCNWLSEQEGIAKDQWCYPDEIKEGMKPFPDYLKRKGYRLPSEAEWEYACRAGTETSRYFGSSVDLLPRYAWFLGNARDRTWPVSQKRPNDLGLFDMQGNVWCWTNDPAFYYAQPTGGVLEDREFSSPLEDRVSRVLRGGSFYGNATNLRSPYRVGNRPSNRYNAIGVRVARTYD
jgi:formylglycine-generating enzyme required for sulfatase activity